MMSQKEPDPGVIAKPTMAQVVTSGGKCTLQMPIREIITPAPSNGTLAELQAITNRISHQRTRSAPNANQLIGDGAQPFTTQQFPRKSNNKPGP